MTPQSPTTTAETCALVQHFLLYHGARYSSRASEENWKHVPVTLRVTERHLPAGAVLPAGSWLVLPWDTPTIEQLTIWLERLASSGQMPRVVVVVMAAPMLREAMLARLAAQFGTEVIAVSAADQLVYGGPTARSLQHMYDPQQLQVLDTVNPLEHLASLGDPRNPEVFFERLRRAGHGIPVTLLLIAINVVVFLVMTPYGLELHRHELVRRAFDMGRVVPQGLDWSAFIEFFERGFLPEQLGPAGANIAGLTVGKGQTWRLLTCAFIHANLLHIGMNMWVLKALGETAERLFGSTMFAALFLLSGVGGSIASLAWTLRLAPNLPSVGASGAVFGIMGGLLGFAFSRRNSVPVHVYKSLLRSGLLFACVNIGLGFIIPMIDNAAHIGGLGVGIVCGVALSRDLPPAPQPSPGQRVVVLAACVGVLGLAYQFAAQLVRL
jgi:membrane associated rhomboid family serine protease